MKYQQLKIKLIPYKIVFGISSSLFGTSTIITWMFYSISEVDFNFFIEHYGLYSVVILIASLLSLVFLAFIPLNKVMKIVHEYESIKNRIDIFSK